MLTRIEIDGFKTFKDFALDVPPFLLVLGQNAAGKSNLFDALAFLSRLAQGRSVMDAVRADRSQLTELLHRDGAGRRSTAVRFAVELAPDLVADAVPGAGPGAARARYELDLELARVDGADPEDVGVLAVAGERCFVAAGPGADGRPAWEPRPYSALFGPVEAFEFGPEERSVPGYPADRILRVGLDLRHPDRERADVPWPELAPDHLVHEIRAQLVRWHVLGLEPSALRRPDSFDDEDQLSGSGEHLPNALARAVRRTRRPDRPDGVLADIRNQLAVVIPEIVDVRLIEVKELRLRSLAVAVLGEGEFTAQAASDGTLRALALVTALNDPDRTGLLCLEEPENGLFPRRLGHLIRLLAAAVQREPGRQVIVSSHSPAALAALPEATGQALRGDAVLLATASRVLDRPGEIRRVTVARPLRGDPSVPLPADLPGPVMSTAEIEGFLGRGTAG